MMQRDNIKINDMQYHEIPYIAEIEKRCFSICAWTENMFRSMFDDADHENIMLTAYADGMIAGYIVMQLCADEAEIMVIAVDEPFRRRGIADMLIDCAERQLTEKTVKILLEVRENNIAAQKLYYKKGFEKTGLRKNYYRDFSGKPPENAVLMTKYLKTEMFEKC